jgi:hypothetical protein
MGLMRSWFGPSKQEIWQMFSEQVGGQLVDGGFFGSDKVEVRYRDWIVTLDTHSSGSGKDSHTHTRFRAPYLNRDGFAFEIYRESLFSPLGRMLGMQDVQIGDPAFDDNFVIKTNDEAKVRALLANGEILSLLEAQPDVHFAIRDDEGWFGADFPEGVDELYFDAHGLIRDVERLHGVYLLFAEVLDQLCRIGSAYGDAPDIEL